MERSCLVDVLSILGASAIFPLILVSFDVLDFILFHLPSSRKILDKENQKLEVDQVLDRCIIRRHKFINITSYTWKYPMYIHDILHITQHQFISSLKVDGWLIKMSLTAARWFFRMNSISPTIMCVDKTRFAVTLSIVQRTFVHSFGDEAC